MWQLFVDLFPLESAQWRRGLPHPPCRQVIRMLRNILIIGCHWRDLPRSLL